MPTYQWRCESCNHVTDIVRKMADWDQPPEHCEKCEHPKLEQTVHGTIATITADCY